MKIELTTEEADVLEKLLNVAVKAVGLEAAEAALHFQRKIAAARQPKTKKPDK